MHTTRAKAQPRDAAWRSRYSQRCGDLTCPVLTCCRCRLHAGTREVTNALCLCGPQALKVEALAQHPALMCLLVRLHMGAAQHNAEHLQQAHKLVVAAAR